MGSIWLGYEELMEMGTWKSERNIANSFIVAKIKQKRRNCVKLMKVERRTVGKRCEKEGK